MLSSSKRGDTAGAVLNGGSLNRVAGENVGVYGINQGGLGLVSSNYTLNYQGNNLTITKALLNVIADAKTKVYGDADPSLTYQVSGLKNGDTAGAVLNGGSLSRVAGENVGVYGINQGGLGLVSANYDLSYQGNNLTITKALLNVIADAKTKVYGDADPALTYQVAESRAKASGLIAALKSQAPQRLGSHPHVVAALASRNAPIADFWLRGASERQQLQADLSGREVLIVDAEDTFTSMIAKQLKSLGLTVTVRGFQEPYSFDGYDLVIMGPGPGNPTEIGQPKIGHLHLAIRSLLSERRPFLAVCLSHQVLSLCLGLDLQRRQDNVIADAKTKVYGDADPSLTYQVSGLKNGDSAGSILTGGLNRAAGENVGVYGINQGDLALNSGNYDLSYQGNNLTITKALLNVIADAKTKVYGDADPALTYQVSGLKNGDTAGSVLNGGGLVRVSGENVGNYAIQQGGLGLVSGNYDLAYQGNNLTITKALLALLRISPLAPTL